MDLPATQECGMLNERPNLPALPQEQIGILGINGKDYAVHRGFNKIGRDPTCQIILDFPFISRLHAVIKANSNTDVVIMDLKSLLKTKLEGLVLVPYVSYPIKHGNFVEFGDITGIFTTMDDEMLPFTQEVVPDRTAQFRAPMENVLVPESPEVNEGYRHLIIGFNKSVAPDYDISFHEMDTQVPDTTSPKNKSPVVQKSTTDKINGADDFHPNMILNERKSVTPEKLSPDIPKDKVNQNIQETKRNLFSSKPSSDPILFDSDDEEIYFEDIDDHCEMPNYSQTLIPEFPYQSNDHSDTNEPLDKSVKGVDGTNKINERNEDDYNDIFKKPSRILPPASNYHSISSKLRTMNEDIQQMSNDKDANVDNLEIDVYDMQTQIMDVNECSNKTPVKSVRDNEFVRLSSTNDNVPTDSNIHEIATQIIDVNECSNKTPVRDNNEFVLPSSSNDNVPTDPNIHEMATQIIDVNECSNKTPVRDNNEFVLPSSSNDNVPTDPNIHEMATQIIDVSECSNKTPVKSVRDNNEFVRPSSSHDNIPPPGPNIHEMLTQIDVNECSNETPVKSVKDNHEFVRPISSNIHENNPTDPNIHEMLTQIIVVNECSHKTPVKSVKDNHEFVRPSSSNIHDNNCSDPNIHEMLTQIIDVNEFSNKTPVKSGKDDHEFIRPSMIRTPSDRSSQNSNSSKNSDCSPAKIISNLDLDALDLPTSQEIKAYHLQRTESIDSFTTVLDCNDHFEEQLGNRTQTNEESTSSDNIESLPSDQVTEASNAAISNVSDENRKFANMDIIMCNLSRINSYKSNAKVNSMRKEINALENYDGSSKDNFMSLVKTKRRTDKNYITKKSVDNKDNCNEQKDKSKESTKNEMRSEDGSNRKDNTKLQEKQDHKKKSVDNKDNFNEQENKSKESTKNERIREESSNRKDNIKLQEDQNHKKKSIDNKDNKKYIDDTESKRQNTKSKERTKKERSSEKEKRSDDIRNREENHYDRNTKKSLFNKANQKDKAESSGQNKKSKQRRSEDSVNRKGNGKKQDNQDHWDKNKSLDNKNSNKEEDKSKWQSEKLMENKSRTVELKNKTYENKDKENKDVEGRTNKRRVNVIIVPNSDKEVISRKRKIEDVQNYPESISGSKRQRRSVREVNYKEESFIVTRSRSKRSRTHHESTVYSSPSKNSSIRKSSRVTSTTSSNSMLSYVTPVRMIKAPYVCFSSYPLNGNREKLQKLGAVLVEDIRKATVLVTSELKRTFKLLCAIGMGIPIVSDAWITACLKVGGIVDPWPYLMQDREAEQKRGFDLKATLTGKRNYLKGYNLSSTPNTVPLAPEMKLIVESSGGVWREGGNKWLCLTVERDRPLWPRFKLRGATLVKSELILTGVLKQESDIENYIIPDNQLWPQNT